MDYSTDGYRLMRFSTSVQLCIGRVNDATQASKYVMKKWDEWDHSSGFVRNVELLAEEDRYGNPEVLLNATE